MQQRCQNDNAWSWKKFHREVYLCIWNWHTACSECQQLYYVFCSRRRTFIFDDKIRVQTASASTFTLSLHQQCVTSLYIAIWSYANLKHFLCFYKKFPFTQITTMLHVSLTLINDGNLNRTQLFSALHVTCVHCTSYRHAWHIFLRARLLRLNCTVEERERARAREKSNN